MSQENRPPASHPPPGLQKLYFSQEQVNGLRLSSSSHPLFFRQEYCCGLPFPSPGDLPDPGIEPRSPELQALSLPSEPPKLAEQL